MMEKRAANSDYLQLSKEVEIDYEEDDELIDEDKLKDE